MVPFLCFIRSFVLQVSLSLFRRTFNLANLLGICPYDIACNAGQVDCEQTSCLLCQRRLDGIDKLIRHVKESKLHLSNLAIEQEKHFLALTDEDRIVFQDKEKELTYVDRAAQRRLIHGQTEKVPQLNRWQQQRIKEPIIEQPTKNGIGEDNVGNKMLRAMGWQAGSGLGSQQQGIVVPVKAEIRPAGAGLGAAVARDASTVGEANCCYFFYLFHSAL